MNNDNHHESREEYRKQLEKRIHDNVQRDEGVNNGRPKKRKFKWSTPSFLKPAPEQDRDGNSNLKNQPPEVHHYRTPRWVKNIIWALVIIDRKTHV